eukprot:SAG31_NODE_2990_length_4812_cov_6.899215_2_plen_779_part_00
MMTPFLLAASGATLAAATADPPAPSLLWGPKGFQLELDSHTLELRNISVSSADGRLSQAFVQNTEPAPKRTQNALWTLNISDCTTAIPFGVKVNPCQGSDCAATSHKVSADGRTLMLRWHGVPLPTSMQREPRLEVIVNITQRTGDRPGVTLRGSVRLAASVTASRICLQSFALPTLGSIPLQSNETDAMFVPYFFGHVGQCAGNCKMSLLHSADGMQHEFGYMPNGNSRAMQWFAFWSNSSTRQLGLYCAAHDPDSRLQLALVSGEYAQPDGSGGGAALHWFHIPDDPLATLTDKGWTMPYETVLEGFEGDWYDAAQIYREWVLSSARWTRNGDVRTRLAAGQFPRSLTTTPLLIESNTGSPHAHPNDTVSSMRSIMDLLDVKEMINWWSSWNQEYFDTKYPQFTARQGFAQRIAAMRARGIQVVPYTNGRLFDPSIAKWHSDVAIEHMCNSTVGPYRETYHSTGPAANISFYIADPADDYWVQTFVALAAELKGNGVNGMYIDQLASYFPQPCFGRASGAPAGSGWSDGGRKLFNAVSRVLGPDAPIFSESNSEAYIADLHGNMALYGWERCGFVPGFQAVYSGWTVNAGIMEWPVPNKSDATLKTWVTNKPGEDESTDLKSWMAYSALQLVYGHIPGAMMTEDLLFVLQHSTRALSLWRDMMRLRQHEADFLVFGRMLRPPQPTTKVKTVPLCGNKPLSTFPCCPIPVVLANVYMASNGSIGLVIANHGESQADYSATVDVGTEIGAHKRELRVNMPASSAKILLIKLDDECVTK